MLAILFLKHVKHFFTVKNKILYRRENLITIQKNVRMHLSKVKHRPRYMGIKKINSLKVSCIIV